MAYVTAIGPSEAQVEYRLTGLHGCATSDASLVPAGPAVEAIRAHAQALGVEPAELFSSDRQRQIWGRVASQFDARGESYRIKPSTIEGLMKAAKAGDPAEVYGEELQAAAEAEADPRIAYRMDLNERPLLWIGSGLREFGIEPGSELTHEQFDMARAMMRGVDPRTGETLVEPKMAVDARGKLAARPLVEAIQQVAAERGVEPAELFDSERKRAAYGRMERGVHRLGDAHRVRLGDVAKLADALKLDTVALYGQATMDQALQHEDKRVQVGNQGFDLTITLPKSYSVALAFAQGEFAAELEEVFTAALTEAVAAAEGWTAYGMRGHHGDGEAAERVQNSGLMGWVNFHRAARPVGDAPYGDPHLHGHVTIANLGRGEDGKWSTIAAGGRDLYRHARAVDSLMQARVRAITHERWGFEWHRNEDTGVWQITGIPDETVALFSKRSAEVKQLFEALGIPFEEATSAQQKAAAAAVAGRKDEQAVAASDETLRSYWQAEAEAAGHDPAAIIGAVLAPPFPPTGEPEVAQLPRDPADVDAIARWVFRTDEGLTSHRKDFTRAEALSAVADAVSHGVQGLAQVEELTDRVLAHRGLTIRLDEKLPGHLSNTARYTTADIVAAERTILGEARSRFNSGTAVVDEPTLQMAVSTYQAIQQADKPGFVLSTEQLAVLRRILVDGHGVDAVVGVAGAGKTTIMEVARIAWEAQGRVVLGASTAAVAAANLRAEAGIQSSTLALLLQRIRQSGGTRGLVGVDVLVLDEAAMIDDRQLAELLIHASTTGTKIVGIGDPLQLQSPGVGGAFAAVHQVVGGHTLATNYRQRDSIERAALQMWRDGERREALRAYADRGRIVVTDTRSEAMAAMLVSWQQIRNPGDAVHDQIASTLMLAATNAAVDELNVAARAIRRELGELTGPDVEYRLAGGGTLALTTGDIVMIRSNDYRAWRGGEAADVLNGYRGVVVEVDSQRRVLVEWREKVDGGGHRLVREWLEPEYIAGGGLSHGLAMTVHKAQGLTVSDVLVYGPGLAANGAYTALSRDRVSVRLFLPRADMEDEETRLTLGDPASDAEAMDRALAAYTAQLDANDGQEGLIVTELGETLEPLIQPPTTPAEPTPAAATGPVPAARQPMPTGPVPAATSAVPPMFATAVRDVLTEHAVDADAVLAHPAYAALDEALANAAAAGLDPAVVLDRAVSARSLTDAEQLPVVLAWRVDRIVEAEQEAAELAAVRAAEDQAAEFAEPVAEVDEVVVDGATVDVDQAPAERRPVRGERPHVELADDDLRAVAHALAQAENEDQDQAAELAEPVAEVDEVVVDGATVDVDQAPAERRPVRGERPHVELADDDLRAVAHALAQAENEDQDQAAELAEPVAEVDEVVVDGATVDVDQAPAERRPTWRERLHGELTDEELQTAHVSALTQAQQAAAAAAQAIGPAAEKQSRAEAGTGPAAEAVQAQAEAMKQRAEAVQALAELTPEFDATGAQAIELRARLAEAEAGAGSRWRGPRERAAAEAAALRSQLEQVTRRLVELDIQRERLDRLAGPVPARAGAVQQWETTAQALPQMLAQARRSDLQDAALAQANVRALQQRAAEAQASAQALAVEQQIRAEQRPADSLTEGLQRTAARISAAAGDARREHEQDAAYGYEYTDQEWDRSADDGGRSR